MKKKLLGVMTALIMGLTTVLGLAACDGGKISFTIDPIDDKGIVNVRIYGIPSGISTSEDFDGHITRQSAGLYTTTDNTEHLPHYINEKFDKGKWEACLTIDIDYPYYNIGDLKVEVNGKELELEQAHPDSVGGQAFSQLFGFGTYEARYYALVDEISSDTHIKLKGHTEPQPLEIYGGDIYGYDSENEMHTDLRFKYRLNDGEWSEEIDNPRTLLDRLTALNENHLTSDDVVFVKAYFKTLTDYNFVKEHYWHFANGFGVERVEENGVILRVDKTGGSVQFYYDQLEVALGLKELPTD